MAENSESLPKAGKPNITKTEKLTAALAVQILQEAVIRCQHAGIRAGVTEYHNNGDHGIQIVLLGVVLVDRNLMLASAGKEA